MVLSTKGEVREMNRSLRYLVVGLLLGVFVAGVGYAADEAVTGAGTAPAQMETPKKSSDAKYDAVINGIPAALLITMEDPNFGITEGQTKTTASSMYMFPNLSAGVGTIVNEDFYVDVTAGGGILVNDAFRSYMLQALVAGTYNASEGLNVGPHAGILYFVGPEWTSSDNVDLDDSWGYLVGVQMSMGDKIKYLMSVDFLSSSFDVTTKNGAVADDNTMDIQGIAVQFGVRGEF
jgi:hypothetical protein